MVGGTGVRSTYLAVIPVSGECMEQSDAAFGMHDGGRDGDVKIWAPCCIHLFPLLPPSPCSPSPLTRLAPIDRCTGL